MMRPIDAEDDPRPPAPGALWTTLPMLLPSRPRRPWLVAGGLIAAMLAASWAAGVLGPAGAAALVSGALVGWVFYRNLR